MKKAPLTFALIFAAILVTLAAYAAMKNSDKSPLKNSYQNTSQSTNQYQVSQTTNNRAITLSFSPETSTIKRGQTFSVTVLARTDRTILATDLYLRYNPQAVNIIKITPGTYFENPTILYNKIDEAKGTITYSLGAVKPTGTGKSLIVITFRAKNTSGQNTLTFEPNTLISTKESDKETISITKPGTYTIQ